jgi:hypothetical protein
MAADGRSLAAIEYLQQSLDDTEVRKNLARGAEAIRRAANQLTGDRNRVPKSSRRTRLLRQLREAVTSFGRAGAAAREAELARQRSRRRRRLVLVMMLMTAGAGASPAVRGKARDLTGGQGGDGEPQPAAAMPEPTAVPDA